MLTGEKNAVFIQAFGDIAKAREQLNEQEEKQDSSEGATKTVEGDKGQSNFTI